MVVPAMRTVVRESERTGRALWRARAAASPQRTFLRCEGRTWTYAEFDREVLAFAGGLRARGVAQGTRVLLGLTNRPETIALQLATQQLGAVAIPMVPGLTYDEA